MALFAHRHKLRWLAVTDFIAPLVPLGLAAGRLGNFINGELWGRATDLPWGMVFPQAADGIARHPSQLYQFAGEGLLLFVILWLFSQQAAPGRRRLRRVPHRLRQLPLPRRIRPRTRQLPRPAGAGLSMGQWLSLPMVVAGVLMLRWAQRQSGSSPT